MNILGDNGYIDAIQKLVFGEDHPFVKESMDLFSDLSEKDKQKVHFIHFNHTNPLLINESYAQKEVSEKGFNLAREGQIIEF